MFYVYVTKTGEAEITEEAEDVPTTADIKLITPEREAASRKLRSLRG